jgi:hypothetical protein
MYMFININIKETPTARVNAESDGRKMLKRATRGAWVPTSYVLRDIKTGVEDRPGWRHAGATARRVLYRTKWL